MCPGIIASECNKVDVSIASWFAEYRQFFGRQYNIITDKKSADFKLFVTNTRTNKITRIKNDIHPITKSYRMNAGITAYYY